MQLSQPYGWIHWDAASKSWHTVTGYELGDAGQPGDTVEAPLPTALRLSRAELSAAVSDGVADALRKLGVEARVAEPGGPAHPGAPVRRVPRPPSLVDLPAVAAVVSSNFDYDIFTESDPAARSYTPSQHAQPPQNQATPPAQPTQPKPPSIPADPAAWDADHKRDGDRDDTQHTVDNTRWDTQHSLDNSRWDARHTLENTRWDTQHSLDNSRWDTRHTLDNSRWDATLALKRAREDTALAADMSLLSAVHGAYVTVAQGSLDRAVQRATYVTTAAGVIGTVYTGVLAARYTISHQAPARSILPALFIGAAVAFSTWYMAFLRGHTREQQFLLSGAGGKIAETRLLTFMEWTFSGVLARAWSLRASVISLGLGLALLPIGLIQLSSRTTWLLGIAAAAVLVLWLAGEAYVARRGPGVDNFLNRQQKKPLRLAPAPPDLPPPPTGGFDPTTPPDYGMQAPPPQPPGRANSDDPPNPPEVAAGDPPAAPQGTEGADPPEPPDVAWGAPPAKPDPLSAGPRPAKRG